MGKKIAIMSTAIFILAAASIIWTSHLWKNDAVSVYNESTSQIRSQTVDIDQKSYTLMIYMNGSDLESKYACATEDLLEMAYSGFDEDNINLILLTGGCNEWHTEGISNDVNTIYQLRQNSLYKLSDAGDRAMGDPDVLSDFIRFCRENFPADQYGLIFWNHGGGAVVGYGYDERHPEEGNATMKLSDINTALSDANIDKNLSFIGFDTCLMATLEMAGIAQQYADYLIASEEVEPGGGWDYAFLQELQPGSTGLEAGKAAVDYFSDYYTGTDEWSIATLSVVDLSRVGPVVEAIESLAEIKEDALAAGEFNRLSRAREGNRAFGSGGEDGETDMIDIAGLVNSLAHLYPEETRELESALVAAVPYQRYGTPETLGGLSIYYPYANKENLDASITVYRSMDQLPNYTSYISTFSGIIGRESSSIFSPLQNSKAGRGTVTLTRAQQDALVDLNTTVWRRVTLPDDTEGYIELAERRNASINESGRITQTDPITLTTINGQIACLYDGVNDGIDRYYIPIKLNGDEASLVVDFESSNGHVLGAIPVNEDMFDMQDKKVLPIEDGDLLVVRYRVGFFDESGAIDYDKKKTWIDGESFVVRGGLTLDSLSSERDDLEMLCFTDTCNNRYFVPYE